VEADDGKPMKPRAATTPVIHQQPAKSDSKPTLTNAAICMDGGFSETGRIKIRADQPPPSDCFALHRSNVVVRQFADRS
jgi:hypothetical protein